MSISKRICFVTSFVFVVVAYASMTFGQQYYQQGQRYYPNQRYPAQPQQQTLTTSHWAGSFTFGARTHDFGVVPTASVQEHVFEFKNTLDQAIELTGIRTSCGCTKPSILTKRVEPGEVARVLAKFDTLKFRGSRGATLSVSIKRSKPYVQYGEVQFSVKGKIRQDVVLSPGKIEFKDVKLGEGSQRTVLVKYAGDTRWKIQDVKSTNPNITVEHKEVKRDLRTGLVSYELNVRLDKSQAEGMFNDTLTLMTNDANSSQMAVNLSGNVNQLLSFSPIRLGTLSQGAKVKKRLILRGKDAFSIKDIRVNNPRITFDESPTGSKSLHILNYTVDTTSIGAVEDMVTVVTDQAGQTETKIPFKANIVQGIIADDR